MGDDAVLDLAFESETYLNLDYTTTTEFADITNLTFILGTSEGEWRKSLDPSEVTGLNNDQYHLLTLLDEIFEENGAEATVMDEYFYIRVELETQVDYSDEVYAYRTDYDIFRSFTNPIWIKWSDISTQIDEDKNGIVLYPNPVSNSLFIQMDSPSNFDKLVMYDPLGKLIVELQIEESILEVDMSNFSNGIYQIVMMSETGKPLTQKLIKI